MLSISTPHPARKPTAAGVKRVPLVSAVCPFLISAPCGRTLVPFTNCSSSIISTPFVSFVFSCITTVSVPRGTGAPVKILTALAPETDSCSASPAADTPVIARPFPNVQSWKGKAYPSIEDWLKAGISVCDNTSSARTDVPASDNSILTIGKVCTFFFISSLASFTDIILLFFYYPPIVIILRLCISSACNCSKSSGI